MSPVFFQEILRAVVLELTNGDSESHPERRDRIHRIETQTLETDRLRSEINCLEYDAKDGFERG